MNTIIRLLSARLGILLSLCATCGLQAQTTPAGPDPSLVLHFDFDEDFSAGRVEDVTGNGHDGWNMQGTNWITATNGVFGSTAGFWYTNGMTTWSGSYPLSTYLAVTNVNGLTNLTTMTVSVWMWTDPTAQASTMAVVSSAYSVVYAGNKAACSNSWDFRRLLSRNMILIVSASDGDYDLLTFPDDTVGNWQYPCQTEWHHYVFTVDTLAHQAVGYHDGTPFQTNALLVPYVTVYGGSSTRWLCVGAAAHDGVPQWGSPYTPNDSYFAGRMDDLRIYNRVLSAAEVQALYQGSTYAQNLGIENAAQNTVQICWPTTSNLSYQVEYQSSLSGGPWTSLGSPISGDGQTNCLSDSTLGTTSRFYRVRVLP